MFTYGKNNDKAYNPAAIKLINVGAPIKTLNAINQTFTFGGGGFGVQITSTEANYTGGPKPVYVAKVWGSTIPTAYDVDVLGPNVASARGAAEAHLRKLTLAAKAELDAMAPAFALGRAIAESAGVEA